jgi:hypothetical protein
MQHLDDPLATETIEHRRRVEAEDAKFRVALSQALQRGNETLQGCVGRHERLRNRNGAIQAIESTCEGALKRRRFPKSPASPRTIQNGPDPTRLNRDRQPGREGRAGVRSSKTRNTD